MEASFPAAAVGVVLGANIEHVFIFLPNPRKRGKLGSFGLFFETALLERRSPSIVLNECFYRESLWVIREFTSLLW